MSKNLCCEGRRKSASTIRVLYPPFANVNARLLRVVDFPSLAPPLTKVIVLASADFRLNSIFVRMMRYPSASGQSSGASLRTATSLGMTASTGTFKAASTSCMVLTLVSIYSMRKARPRPRAMPTATAIAMFCPTSGFAGISETSAFSQIVAGLCGIDRCIDSVEYLDSADSRMRLALRYSFFAS